MKTLEEMRQLVVAATKVQMQEDMDYHIETQMKNQKEASLAQVTRMAQATLNHTYGGQDGQGDAKAMMAYLCRKGSYLRCCIS